MTQRAICIRTALESFYFCRYACTRRSARTPNALASASKPANPMSGSVLAVFGKLERLPAAWVEVAWPDVPTAPCVSLGVDALDAVLGVRDDGDEVEDADVAGADVAGADCAD